MLFGSQILCKGETGPTVAELQLRLAGFRGTCWDGVYGPGTELQVITFQRDYMKMDNPSGIVAEDTFEALDRFAQEFVIDFSALACPECQCQGFGKNRFHHQYIRGKPRTEQYHKCEYPGVHKAILHTYRAAQFYAKQKGLSLPFISSGYRCWIYNDKKQRSTTNHLGKALDIDFPSKAGEDKRDDCRRCDSFRGILVEKCNFQLGWGANNVKSLEPANIAPSWIHLDVRCYTPNYLADKYFVKTAAQLDSKEIGKN